MKKILYSKLTILLLLFSACLAMTGCRKEKTYANLEEWYADHNSKDSELQSELNRIMHDGTVEFAIEQNVIIFRFKYNKEFFTKNARTNQYVKSFIDNDIENAKSSFLGIIDSFAEASGIDASKLSIRVEHYSAGSTTPNYSKIYTK